MPFHGGNRGSNPLGDANLNNKLARTLPILAEFVRHMSACKQGATRASLRACRGPTGRAGWQAWIKRRGYPKMARTCDLKGQAESWAK